jgi:hypothetical protein
MTDLAIAYRIYPGISKTPAFFSENKLELSALCLRSFRRALGSLTVKVWAILDGCPAVYEDLFREQFSERELEIVRLDGAGNLSTFSMQLDLLTAQTEADFVYFAEDDYYYLPDALVKVLEFARSNDEVDFVTPYDHPGNYDTSNGRERHLVRTFGDHHWRTASATCLTFLASRDVLVRTRKIFGTYGRNNNDGSLWLALTEKTELLDPRVHWRNAGRRHLWLKTWFWGYQQILFDRSYRLWGPLPSLATHMEVTCMAPLVDWGAEFLRSQDEALQMVQRLLTSSESK